MEQADRIVGRGDLFGVRGKEQQVAALGCDHSARLDLGRDDDGGAAFVVRAAGGFEVAAHGGFSRRGDRDQAARSGDTVGEDLLAGLEIGGLFGEQNDGSAVAGGTGGGLNVDRRRYGQSLARLGGNDAAGGFALRRDVAAQLHLTSREQPDHPALGRDARRLRDAARVDGRFQPRTGGP